MHEWHPSKLPYTEPGFSDEMNQAIERIVYSVKNSVEVHDIRDGAPREYNMLRYPNDRLFSYVFADRPSPIIVHAIPVSNPNSAYIACHALVAWLPPESQPLERHIIREFTKTSWRNNNQISIAQDPEQSIEHAISLYSGFLAHDQLSLRSLHGNVVDTYTIQPHVADDWKIWAAHPTARILGFDVPFLPYE